MSRATLLEPFPIHIQLGTGQVSLYPQAKVYTIAGVLDATLSLPHISEGLYGVAHTFTQEGHYTIVYNVYTDAGFTTGASFDSVAEGVEVNSDKTNIIRILGLTHDNVVIDSQTYDNVTGNLTFSRVRHYSSAANANTATAVGLLNTWNISAGYNGTGELTQYKVIKV